MNNFVNEVEIKNFKSIKDLKFDAKQINVFIGKPNVGKSNILEAISLLGAGYSDLDKGDFLKDIIRFEELSNLFNDENLKEDVFVKADNFKAQIHHFNESNEPYFLVQTPNVEWYDELFKFKNSADFSDYFWRKFNNDPLNKDYFYQPDLFTLFSNQHEVANKRANYNSPFRKYDFKKLKEINNKFSEYLLPPYGKNLFWSVFHNEALADEIAFIIKSYGLDFTLFQKEGKFEILKKEGLRTYKYPYSNLADTFQRLIFYFAAIDSNENSVLIFEEPEVHAFPPYTQSLAYRIVNDTKNQYFISTHSPYLLETLLENTSEEQINIYLTYYNNFNTELKLLSKSELDDFTKYGYDIYFNLDQLLAEDK